MRGPVVALGAWALLAACRPAARFEPGTPALPPAPAASGPPRAPMASGSALDEAAWPVPVPARDLAPAPGEARVATGHAGGRYSLRVSTSDLGAYRALDPSRPGFTACAEHQEAGGGAPGPLLCVRRGASGALRFGVASPGASAWLREGALEDCALCHLTSAHQGLFGPP